jgi:hypothetical protein
MDRVVAPETSSAGIPWPGLERFGSIDADTKSESLDQLDGPDELVPEPATPSSTLIGRPDIDTAMLDALGHAMGHDHGFPGPGWVSPDRGRLGGGRQADRDDSAPASSLAVRSDIDMAMLDALRHAFGSDGKSPDA